MREKTHGGARDTELLDHAVLGRELRPGAKAPAPDLVHAGGGTSEIIRNQIAERLLGLPRDPLIK